DIHLSKAYGIYNKRTECVKESIHVIFDKSGELCNMEKLDKVGVEELWKIERDALDDAKEPTSETARPGGEQGPTSNKGQGSIPKDQQEMDPPQNHPEKGP
ncbi:hypothetical protein HAX54_037947, partial [Datura stramonium]|nr:hypothetical protein [Datura stramonium]